MKQQFTPASERTGGTPMRRPGRAMSVPPSPLRLIRTLLLAGVLLPLFAIPSTRAAELTPSGTRNANDWFGSSVSILGDTVYVGANLDDDLGENAGTVSIYRNISTATGTLTEDAKLYSFDETANDNFGTAISLSGNNALVTSLQDDTRQGSAFLILNISSTTPTQVKLGTVASPSGQRWLGASASLSGNSALIGTNSELSGNPGEAYLYRNLDSTIVETRLTDSGGSVYGDRYGSTVALAGDIALVGSPLKAYFGAVFMYQNLGSVTPVETRIQAFDADGNDFFGGSVAISGTTALVGARSQGSGYDAGNGAAYVIRNLDTTPVQTKLVASDGVGQQEFGSAVSLSGNTALVGAIKNGISGAAYLFFNVNSGGADATVTEDLKILPSNGGLSDRFGFSVSIDGDNFVVGAYNRNSGRGGAYTGSVSSMTTMDTGNTTRSIDAISFISRGDWIIGQTTDGNIAQLTSGDTADVTSSGKAVYIGKNTGSDNNTLVVSGALTTNGVHVGLNTGNTGNKLQIGDGGTTGSVAGDIINHGNVTFNRSDSSQHGNQISGTGTVTKLGVGTVTLTAVSTYTGPTTINNGKLVVDGSIASSMVAINDGGTLAGHGTVGAVTIASGGTISPGNSPGILNTGTQTWSGGGTYLWDLNAATGVAGMNWDSLNITGALSLDGLASNNPFSIDITSLGVDNNPGAVAGFDLDQNYSWILLTASGGVTGFSVDKFAIDSSGFLNLPDSGGFSVSQVGNNVVLNFGAVPEPSRSMLLVCALGGLMLQRRRGRGLKSQTANQQAGGLR